MKLGCLADPKQRYLGCELLKTESRIIKAIVNLYFTPKLCSFVCPWIFSVLRNSQFTAFQELIGWGRGDMGSIYQFSYPTFPVIPTPSVGTPDSLCISIAIHDAMLGQFRYVLLECKTVRILACVFLAEIES